MAIALGVVAVFAVLGSIAARRAGLWPRTGEPGEASPIHDRLVPEAAPAVDVVPAAVELEESTMGDEGESPVGAEVSPTGGDPETTGVDPGVSPGGDVAETTGVEPEASRTTGVAPEAESGASSGGDGAEATGVEPEATGVEPEATGVEPEATGVEPEASPDGDGSGGESAAPGTEPVSAPEAAEPEGASGDELTADDFVARARSAPPALAEAYYRRALALEPQNHYAMVGLARILLERGAAAEALPFAEDAVRRRSRRAAYRVLLGDVRRAAGDESGAREAWEAALEIEPDNRQALQRLGR